MSVTYPHTDRPALDRPRAAPVPTDPIQTNTVISPVAVTTPLTAVEPENTRGGPVVLTLIGIGIACGAFHAPFAGIVAIAVVGWSLVILQDILFGRFHEPIARISSADPELAQSVAAEFTLTPKTQALIRRVVVGFACDEVDGESSHTETFDGWTSPGGDVSIGPDPFTIEGILDKPTLPKRRWRDSSLHWYLTLRVEVAGGLTLRRRYAIPRRQSA